MSQLHTQEAELQASCQKNASNSSLMHMKRVCGTSLGHVIYKAVKHKAF